MSAFELPSPLQQRVEACLRSMLQPPGLPAQSFAEPHGEAALHAPDSVCWRLFKNPVALFVGGVAAVILELAEPRVRTGVWTHTSFRERPVERLQRTGLAAMMTVYGPASRSRSLIAAVRRRHDAVAGVTPRGEPYRANDPVLLQWVHATACHGLVAATHAYVRPLPRAERDRFYAESGTAALLYGAASPPASQAQFDALLAAMCHRLERSEIVFDFLRILGAARALPDVARPVQGLLIRAAVEITPPWVRVRLGLDASWGLRPWQRPLVAAIAGQADRLLLRTSPPVQACRRLGLPDDYLYRAPAAHG